MPRQPRPQYRFGVGEWYGQSFAQLTPEERQRFAAIQVQPETDEERVPCPFLSRSGVETPCWKIGGVCSLRSYQKTAETVQLDQRGSSLRVTCPSRFEEGGIIYQWIAEVILGTSTAVPTGQVSFLERVPLMGATEEAAAEGEGVGRIDNVLIVPGSHPLQWCPVEIQAVYFSGDAMRMDFAAYRDHGGPGIPFPAGRRRPDYRSSGPKRLMPQLQIKVPTLRRWGKKMAVVVDEDFIKNLGRMETVDHVSNADVAWFVVRFDETSGKPHLVRGEVYLTQLEGAVAGLIAGKPVTQHKFEERILAKLSRLASSPAEVPSDE